MHSTESVSGSETSYPAQPGAAALGDDWMRYLPEELRESFVKAQVRSRLNSLSAETPLSQDLASIYLDVSDATLKRLRSSGKGPQYIQGVGEEGAKSRNQKVLYTVGALKEWIAQNKTSSTGHAAIRRGLMFESISDMVMPEPWWEKEGAIVGHGYSFFPELHDWEKFQVVWFGVDVALSQKWASAQKKMFSACAQKLLHHTMEHLKAMDEQNELEMYLKEVDK